MSDTPETDAFFMGTDIDWDLEVQFAKRLERERDKAREQRDRLAEALRKFVGDALFCSHADTATDVLPPEQVDDDGDALTMP